MNFLPLIFITLSFHYVISAPTEDTRSVYDAIIEKCPSVGSLSEFKNLTLFNTCKSWKSISEVNNFDGNNVKQIQCLLYFVTFTSYCVNREKPDVKIPKSVIANYDSKMVCDYFKNITYKGLGAIFNDQGNCVKICEDDVGWVNSLCSVSYYFAHEKTNTTENKPKQNLKSISPHEYMKDNENSKKLKNQETRPAKNDQNESGINSSVPRVMQVLLPNAHENVSNEAAQKAVLAYHAKVMNTSKSVLSHDSPVNTTVIPANVESQEQIDDPSQNGDNTIKNSPPETHQNKDNENEQVGSQNEVTSIPTSTQNIQKVGPGDNKVSAKITDENFDNQEKDVYENQEGEDDDDFLGPSLKSNTDKKTSKSLELGDIEPINANAEMDGDSYFFTYFMILCIIFIVGYVCYHNKQKILALILEGRRGKRQYRGRRPNSANYHKLDSNLEEAINSSCKKNMSNVIY